jgi:hypothetical protein
MSELLERPKIKDFFPEETTVSQVNKVYAASPELFKYIQALDNYIDESETKEAQVKKVMDLLNTVPLETAGQWATLKLGELAITTGAKDCVLSTDATIQNKRYDIKMRVTYKAAKP